MKQEEKVTEKENIDEQSLQEFIENKKEIYGKDLEMLKEWRNAVQEELKRRK